MTSLTPFCKHCCVLSGVFFSCLFVLLSLSVLVLLACLFLSVVSLAWLCLLAAALGRCVRLLVRSLARWFGRCLCLVLLLLSLLALALGWLALLWRFVLAFVLSLARFGSSLFLSCVESFLGVRPPFFLAIATLQVVSLIARFISACLHKMEILAQPFPTVDLPPIPLLCCAFRLVLGCRQA
jgi:hypothetical protein